MTSLSDKCLTLNLILRLKLSKLLAREKLEISICKNNFQSKLLTSVMYDNQAGLDQTCLKMYRTKTET